MWEGAVGSKICLQNTRVPKRTSEGKDARYFSQQVVYSVEKAADLFPTQRRWERSGGQALDEPGGG